MAAIPGGIESRPGQSLAIRGYSIEDALIDHAFGRAFAEERVAIDEPHADGLTQTVRSLRILVNVLAIEFPPELSEEFEAWERASDEAWEMIYRMEKEEGFESW